MGLVGDGLPGRFLGWLAAASVSGFGDALLFFALGWAATGLGPSWAGLVLTSISLPRAVFLLLGGAVGDRWGPRRVMIVADSVMVVVLLVVVQVRGVSGPLLIAAGLAVGVVGAFHLPASGSFPRLLVGDEQLPRALALRLSATQLIGLLGGPVGGVLVAAGGLPLVAAVDAVTFGASLLALLVIRPVRSGALVPRKAATAARTTPGATTKNGAAVQAIGRRSLLRDAVGGVRFVVGDPSLRTLSGAAGLFAAFLLPMSSLGVPLLVRAHGWGSGVAGLVLGGSACGGLAVALVVVRRGAFVRAGLVSGIGPVLAAVAMAWQATAATTVPAAIAGGVLQGVGTGLFVSHLGPLFLTRVAETHLARAQSKLVLVQSVPLLFSTNLVAAAAGRAGAPAAVLLCASGTALAGAALLVLPRLRAARLGQRADLAG